jgi:hypothetical protein
MSREKSQESVENINSWQDAVVHTQKRIKELRQSLRVFRERVKRGEPWPGSPETGVSEQQHSV